jgi:hypothetical protein
MHGLRWEVNCDFDKTKFQWWTHVLAFFCTPFYESTPCILFVVPQHSWNLDFNSK